MITLTITNDVAELAALEPFVEQIADAFDIDPATSFKLQLALDESLTNVVMYAYPDQKNMPILLEADVDETEGKRVLVFRLIDQGIPFDPLASAPEVDVTLSAEERQIGGLGIFLVRQMMDEVTYLRNEGKNILTMKKHLE